MHQLLIAIGAVALTALAMAGTAEPIVVHTDLTAFRRQSLSDSHWLFGATLRAPLTLRDWIIILAVLAVVGANFFLWSLPISQTALLFISAPIGIVALIALMWFAPRQ